jgi:succinoglycan biosynthesis protein ExoM
VIHVSVCIPTYRRPRLLERCLEGIRTQHVDGFDLSVVVVDNDCARSGAPVVEAFRQRCAIEALYGVEPVPNISVARNRAVALAKGDLVAFIDDDEVPDADWLAHLVQTHCRTQADGVLGPVVPAFEGTPPAWLVESGLCTRRMFPTGTLLDRVKELRSGNVLLARHLVEEPVPPFDPRFGRTGGEDTDFFQRKLRGGARFVWCNEARVREAVPKERQTLRYYVRRACLLGRTAALREAPMSIGTLKSLVALPAYVACMPLVLLLGYPRFVNVFIRACNHAAKLLGHLGIRLAEERRS